MATGPDESRGVPDPAPSHRERIPHATSRLCGFESAMQAVQRLFEVRGSSTRRRESIKLECLS